MYLLKPLPVVPLVSPVPTWQTCSTKRRTLTARRRKEAITLGEIDDAVDRVVAGMGGKPLTDGRSKRLISPTTKWVMPWWAPW